MFTHFSWLTYNMLGDIMALKGIVIDAGHGGSDPGAVDEHQRFE